MPKLPNLQIAKPCDQDWDAMPGNARARHCDACGKDALNLAVMTRREVERVALRAAAGEPLCARVTRRRGELVMLEPISLASGRMTRSAVLTAALATGLSAAAQAPEIGAADTPIKEVAPEPEAVPGMAIVIGRLLHPDGTRVDTGLVCVRDESGAEPLYVLDTSGWFELRLKPGRYNFVMRTGVDQFERVASVDLHEGIQQFSDLRTRTGLQATLADETEVTMGTVVGTVEGAPFRWWIRHPVAYMRFVGRRIRRTFTQ